ncbi:peptidoglycan-binding protein [Agromyces mediolanus]|uniref:peptidoglycan-binding domain-containing protein n=1 Tax=Agromyces mediolanus TaxID=41986 RepID=UPI002040F1BA|nr:peptidoglycan-binding domain-containing protein [Agromyces mediolanus]MCM3659216.1 peptidoglycan-binding protein [Agromyces mediolanus]
MPVQVLTATERPAPRRAPRIIAALVLLVAGAGAGWAATAVFAPPDEVTASPYTYVEVVAGEVGSSVRLTTVAAWRQVPAGTNRAAGTVTSVELAAGDEVRAGSVLYSVELRPVVAAVGEVPAFRQIGRDAQGPDVRQLQQLLTDLGHYDGLVDGGFGPRTEAAVKAWQGSLELPADGVVQAGDLVFLPALPGRVTLDDKLVRPGASLSGGEQLVSMLPRQPEFTIPVSRAQAATMPIGTAVEIGAPDGGVWSAAIVAQEPSAEADDQVGLRLGTADGAPICADACATIPVLGDARLASTVVTQAATSGLVVPAAALRSSADGTVAVVDREGRGHPVTVVASARGMAVVDGVRAGLRVRVPADARGGDESAGARGGASTDRQTQPAAAR